MRPEWGTPQLDLGTRPRRVTVTDKTGGHRANGPAPDTEVDLHAS
jgi:hypothetical protein